MPMRSELQISRAAPSYRLLPLNEAWSWIVATIQNPEFLMIVLFCAVGLWLTFDFIQRFPDFGAMVDLLEP